MEDVLSSLLDGIVSASSRGLVLARSSVKALFGSVRHFGRSVEANEHGEREVEKEEDEKEEEEKEEEEEEEAIMREQTTSTEGEQTSRGSTEGAPVDDAAEVEASAGNKIPRRLPALSHPPFGAGLTGG